MKNLLVLLLMIVVSTAVQATVLIYDDFETADGYPETWTSAETTCLYDHGWSKTSSIWYVPDAAADTFANTGSRSAMCTVGDTSGFWCNYYTDWTPTDTESVVSYSAAIAFQKRNNKISSTTTGGIILRGMTSSLAEVEIGKMVLGIDGTVTISSTSDSQSSTYIYSLADWYDLEIAADFANDTVKFLLDGVTVGSLSFSSDVISFSSIALYCNRSTNDANSIVRFDTVSVETIPEPATVCLLSFGVLGLIGKRK